MFSSGKWFFRRAFSWQSLFHRGKKFFWPRCLLSDALSRSSFFLSPNAHLPRRRFQDCTVFDISTRRYTGGCFRRPGGWGSWPRCLLFDVCLLTRKELPTTDITSGKTSLFAYPAAGKISFRPDVPTSVASSPRCVSAHDRAMSNESKSPANSRRRRPLKASQGSLKCHSLRIR